MIINIHDKFDTSLTGENKITMQTKKEDYYGIMNWQ